MRLGALLSFDQLVHAVGENHLSREQPLVLFGELNMLVRENLNELLQPRQTPLDVAVFSVTVHALILACRASRSGPCPILESHHYPQVIAHPVPAILPQRVHNPLLRLPPAIEAPSKRRLALWPQPNLFAIRRDLPNLDQPASGERLQIPREGRTVEPQIVGHRRDRSRPELMNTRQQAEKRPANRRVGHLFCINSADNMGRFSKIIGNAADFKRPALFFTSLYRSP